MKRFLLALLLTLVVGAIGTGDVLAQIPRTISFQGVLADANGVLLPDNNYNLTLSVYEAATGGTPIFSESMSVAVYRGVFNAIIGANNGGIPEGVLFDRAYWLGIQVNNGAELSPRTPFTSVPYALNAARAVIALRADVADTALHAVHAATADAATIADTAFSVRGGHVASINGQQGVIELLGAGATTITRSGNQFIIRSADTSGGGIQRIDNFDGALMIDPPQGPFVTVTLRAGGVQTYHLSDMSITTDKIVDGAVTNAKLGPNSVTTDKIMDGQVMTSDIADLNVTNEKIGPDAVTTDKIMDANVTTGDIADFNVTLPKIDPTGAGALQAVIFDGANVVWGSPAPGGPAGGDLTGWYPDPEIAADAVTTAEILNATILTEDIADAQIDNAKLAADAVTTDKIFDGSVGNGDLAADAVTTDKIFDGAVGNADLAADAVTTDKIFDGAVGNLDLAADAVTTDKIADANVTTNDIADANVTLTKLDVTGAVAGQGITFDGANAVWGNPVPGGAAGGDLAGTYPNPDIAADAVTTAEILNATILTEDIADGQIDNLKLAADAVTTDKIFDGSVGNADLAADAVTTDKIFDGSVGNLDLAADAVTTDKIFDGSVGNLDLAADAVTTDKIFDGTVGNADLAADAVTTDKIFDGAVGNLDLAADAVTTDRIADANVTTNDIADANVTLQKLDASGAAAGQAISYDGAFVTWSNPTAGALVIPFAQSANEMTSMVSLTNTNAAGDVLTATASGAGSAIVANATTGYAVEARNAGGTVVDARNTNGMALYAEGFNNYAAWFQGAGPSGHGIRVNSSELGIHMTGGRFVGTYQGFVAGGSTLGRSRVVFEVMSDGIGGSLPGVTLPAIPENGAIIVVTTADPDGATVTDGATTWSITRTIGAMFVKTADGWKSIQ